MQKVLTIICALIVALIFPLAALVANGLPADTRALVAEKYAGWNGVLQAWVCCEWSDGFISWMNGCAADFEKRHEGVYIEFTPVTPANVRVMLQGDIAAPDMLLFSPGVVAEEEQLLEIDAPADLRRELRFSEHAYPVAMGGYILLCNPSLGDAHPQPVQIADDSAHCYSAALAALTSDPTDATEEFDPGLDLGLPANAAGKLSMEMALDAFMDGDLACMPATQAELAKLDRLRQAGRGPDWVCAPSGRIAYSDQLLLLGLPAQNIHPERIALSKEFGQLLTGEDAQAMLVKAGAFAVTGAAIHPAYSALAELDGLLNSRPIVVPDCFSEYWQPGAEAIVREQLSGQCSEMPRES